jgi:hypothetical protein
MTFESAFSGAVGRLTEVDPAQAHEIKVPIRVGSARAAAGLLMCNSAMDAQAKGPVRFREARGHAAKVFERLCGFHAARVMLVTSSRLFVRT